MREVTRGAGAIRGARPIVLQSVLTFATALVILAGLPGASFAQPDPAPVAPTAPAAAAPAPPSVAPPVSATAPAAPALPAPAPSESPASPPGLAPMTFGPPSLGAPRAERPARGGDPLSETTALALSLGGTLGAWTAFTVGMRDDHGELALLGFIGTALAPSMGHWYRGSGMTRGLALRLISGTTGFLSLSYLMECDDGCSDTMAYMFLGSFLTYVGASIDDIIRAPLEVRKHNERLELGLAPMVGGHTAGLAIGGRF